LNSNKSINEKLICAFRWSVLPSIKYYIILYIYNIVAQKMCNIKFMVCCVGSSYSGESWYVSWVV